MHNLIKEELQELIEANLVSSEEMSDAGLDSVAGGILYQGTNIRASVRVNGTLRGSFGPVSGAGSLCIPTFLIGTIPVPGSVIENFKR